CLLMRRASAFFSTFFLSRHVQLSVLHSFPTRRSSDLRHFVIVRQVLVAFVRHCGQTRKGSQATTLLMRMVLFSRRFLSCLARFKDRKSTRLNSSHVSISYAVFCLKKKTTNNIIILLID